MSDEVKRYSVRGQFDPGFDLMTTREVVLASDYAALEAENARLERLVSHWQGLAVTNRKVADDALAQLAAIQGGMGEVVDAVAWRVTGAGGLTVTPEQPRWAESDPRLCIEPLMTVAQHQRILAASVPAGCKVVPVELLERLEHVTRTLVPHLQCHVDLRALLASVEGGE